MRPDLPWFCRTTQLFAVAALVAAGTVACSSSGTSSSAPGGGTSSSSTASKSPITIGASLSLSGDFSSDGKFFQQGYELWAADVNAHGGILGRQVTLKILDDHSDPTQVQTNYQTLFASDHVNMAFGPFSSLLTTPSATVAARFQYALIEGAGGSPAVFNSPANQSAHNVFDVSLPVADALIPFTDWVASLPAGQRPKTAAFPTVQDPFTQFQVAFAQQKLAALGVRSVYSQSFPQEVTAYKPQADQVAAAGADVVVLGSIDPPTVAAFMKAFEQAHYNPKMFICTAGPDGGDAFIKLVGKNNADGMMVPNGWSPGYPDSASQAMVQEYVAKYGGTAASVGADVAEAYSVGQVAAQAITATGGTDQAKIIAYLHSGVTLNSVQGPVKFDSLGENTAAAAFVFQWQQHGSAFSQVLPAGASGSVAILATKPAWGG